MILLAILGCVDRDPFPPLPADAARALAQCETEPFPEVATTCRVQAAARAADQGSPEVARRACAEIDPGLWQEECHFRAGEEFGTRARFADGLEHCVLAGRYARFCLVHLAWRAPVVDVGAGDAASVLAARDRLLGDVAPALASAPVDLGAEARALVEAQLWFHVYYGAGKADPAAARAAPPEAAPAARQAFALEAVRLLLPRSATPSPELLDRVAAVWSGAAEPPTGPVIPPEERHGRFHPPVDLPPGLVATLPLYGGDARFVAVDPGDDLAVSTLEAMYFLPDVQAEAFAPHVDDPRPDVRRMATLLVRVTPSTTLDHEALLGRLADDADPLVAGIAAGGLRQREWTRYVGTQRR